MRPLVSCLAAVFAGVVASASCGVNRQGFVKAPRVGDLSHAGVERVRFDARSVDACGEGGPTARSAFDRWPYLQRVHAEGFDLLWTTARPAESRVLVSTTDGHVVGSTTAIVDRGATPPGSATQYTARLDGLPTGTTLCYQVMVAGDAWTRPTGMTTAPDENATVRFTALGDLGKRSPDQLAVARQLRGVRSDFVLVAGDIAYDRGRRRELEHYFFDVYADLLATVPFFVAAGNHDHRTEEARPFREAFTMFETGAPNGLDRWSSFDWGPVHVAVLDTEILDPVQATWLDHDLAATDRPWTVVLMHRPPFSSGHHGSDPEVRDLFVPILERHDVALVLAGHDHNYERTQPIGGVVYVITGGGGRGTRRTGSSDFTAFSARVAHFVWLEARPDRLRLVAVDATGREFDSLRLTRAAAPPAPRPHERHGERASESR